MRVRAHQIDYFNVDYALVRVCMCVFCPCDITSLLFFVIFYGAERTCWRISCGYLLFHLGNFITRRGLTIAKKVINEDVLLLKPAFFTYI